MTKHVLESLPWFVNGRLSTAERTRISQHLENCSVCQTELAAQRRIQAAINQPVKVELAPQSSFNKLWAKIEADEFAHTPSAAREPISARSEKSSWQWLTEKWMPMTLVLETVAIAALGTALLMTSRLPATNGTDASSAYRTVTRSIDAADSNDSTLIHVVFDDATRLSDIKEILKKSGLQVVSGPTTTGVYSLSPTRQVEQPAALRIVQSLIQDPRVRFAELSRY